MRKMMMLVSVLLMSASAFAAAKRTNVEPFKGVNVNTPVRMRFVCGRDYKVDVRSADPVAASAIRMSVEDGVLKIRSLNGSGLTDEVCITVTSPEEPRLSVGRDLEVKSTARGMRADK